MFSKMTGVLLVSDTFLSSPRPVGSWGSSAVEIPVTEDAALGGTGERCSVPGVVAVRRSKEEVRCCPGGGRNEEPKLPTPPSKPFGWTLATAGVGVISAPEKVLNLDVAGGSAADIDGKFEFGAVGKEFA